jgi:hypothetical protein
MADGRVANAQRTEVLDLLTRALEADALPLTEYDRRVAAVGAADYTSELLAQFSDLPPEYTWLPHPEPPPVAPGTPVRAYGRTALVLGIVSVLSSPCVAGLVFGVLAILYSRRGPVRGFGAAMIGRIFGIIGILLSCGAAFSIWYALTHRLGA